MELTVLGSGGNTPIPMPTCGCRVCVEARERGVPYARRGNSLFVHDENVLIDTPELVWHSLNRARIQHVEYVLLSHFHADHTLGLRTLQALGREDPPVTDFVGDTPQLVTSTVTYERAIAETEFFEQLVERWADPIRLEDGATMDLGDLELTHVGAEIESGGEQAVSGFLLEGDATVFVSPDENRHFELDRLPELDLWVKETGYFTHDPEGNPLVTDTAVDTVLREEMTFEESLEQVRQVEPARTVFTEIEELYRRSYDDYRRIEQTHDDLDVQFAYDGMRIRV